MYDVIVIGAGPVGSYTAYQLAGRGFEVALFEEDKEIGKNVVCAGVVGREAFRRFALPESSILTPIKSFRFVLPCGESFFYSYPDTIAFVVDREMFDKGIFELARQKGTDIKVGVRVSNVKCQPLGECEVVGNGKKYKAKAVVIATGINYRLQDMLGMGRPSNFLSGAQVEGELQEIGEEVELHLGQKVAPGSFGWVVPIGNKRARIGVLTQKNGKFWVSKLIKERLNKRIRVQNSIKVKEKLIAHSTIKRSVVHHVLAVGEAAGQVKTTTGGGIFYGLLCSELAVEALVKFLKNRNSEELIKYEEQWRETLEKELQIGYQVREVAKKLDDRTIDKLFLLMKKSPLLANLITRYINFDYHSGLLSFCFKVFKGILK